MWKTQFILVLVFNPGGTMLTAGTQVLKTLIQPELVDGFLKRHNATELSVDRLLGMEFDLVAYTAAESILWVCEMTASGFLGKGRGNFHVGARRKFCEGFAKFSILNLKANDAKEQIRRATNNADILDASIQCRFVVPIGSRFIHALGWRSQLVENLMRVEEIELLDSSREVMIQNLLA